MTPPANWCVRWLTPNRLKPGHRRSIGTARMIWVAGGAGHVPGTRGGISGRTLDQILDESRPERYPTLPDTGRSGEWGGNLGAPVDVCCNGRLMVGIFQCVESNYCTGIQLMDAAGKIQRRYSSFSPGTCALPGPWMGVTSTSHWGTWAKNDW